MECKIKTTDGIKTVPVLDEFTLYGEKFVIHYAHRRNYMVVTHYATGYRVLFDAWETTTKQAKRTARSKIIKIGKTRLLEAIDGKEKINP